MKKKLLDPYRNVNIRELIGLEVHVISHTDVPLRGTRGYVIDETRNTFLVRMEVKDRKISKKGAVFEFKVNGPGGPKMVMIRGDDLLFRPLDRTKKLERKRLLERDISDL